MTSLLLSELMLLKCMYICKWSMMAMKDDNMISLIIWRTNVLLSGLVIMQSIILEDVTCNPIYKSITGTNDCGLPAQVSENSINM